MTRFSGPIKVKMPFSETTVARVDASGSAQFAQGADFGGAVIVDGTMNVSGAATFGAGLTFGGAVSAVATATFVAPVLVGSSANSMGRVVLCQQAEISGNNTKKSMTLPAGSDVLDIKYIPRAPLSASAASIVDIIVGTSADDAKLARFTNVTGMAYHTKTVDTDVSGMASVSGASSILIVGATAVSGAIASAGRGVLTVMYVHKQ